MKRLLKFHPDNWPKGTGLGEEHAEAGPLLGRDDWLFGDMMLPKDLHAITCDD